MGIEGHERDAALFLLTHGEFVAPNGEPLDVGHRLPVRQRERDVLPSIPLQRVRSIVEEIE